MAAELQHHPSRIALAGNPNSGKTTLFNALTGSNQFVGNWPGVTVGITSGHLLDRPELELVDLPGVYSLSPYSPEEIVTRDFLTIHRPDVILNIVDGRNLERNLYLTTQLAELGIPMVIALNKMDDVTRAGDKINLARLSHQLGCPVIGISALRQTGLTDLTDTLADATVNGTAPTVPHFNRPVDVALDQILTLCADLDLAGSDRWFATRLFVRDANVQDRLQLDDARRTAIDQVIDVCEDDLDDDAESILAVERFSVITDLLKGSHCTYTHGELTLSDRLDRIVTNRWLGLPIFAAIMFVVYSIAVSTIGTWITDWTNDVLFGQIITNGANNALTHLHVQSWLQSLIVDGIIAGVGGVLGFVPQLMLLFAMLAALEESGYMARIAFVMDRFFRSVGLSGKSFIPLMIGTGCSVPGIMATRTIERERERKMTIITTSFIPCSAKLTLIALITGAIFGGAWWVAPSAYFVGISAVVVSGILLRKTVLYSGDTGPFVMELPAYRVPSVRFAAASAWERGRSFIKKAGTVILLATILIWVLSNIGVENGQPGLVDHLDVSLLAGVGHLISWIFIPLGWGGWQSAVAAITGLMAKETIVGTFGVLFGANVQSETGVEFWSQLAAHFTAVAGYSFLVFNLLCAPCVAAVGAVRREMNDARWAWFAVLYQTGFAWVIGLIIYQFGSWIAYGAFGPWTVVAIIALVALISALAMPNIEHRASSAGAIAHPREVAS